MREHVGEPWFAQKRYGYGTGMPLRWQGWAAILATVAGVPASIILLDGVAQVAVPALILVGFVAVCALKTKGGWRWRWGERQ